MFEDYMQNYFGYPNPYQDIRRNDFYNQYMEPQGYNMGYNPYNFNVNMMENEKLENFYPDIYNIIEPMVKKICIKNRNTLNQETLDKMVDEIYNNLETNEGINLNITINNEKNKNVASKELNLENRNQNNNNLLKDLIKILILKELISINKPYKNYNRMYQLNTVPWQERPYG